MPEYKLTYARTVIFYTYIDAANEQAAWNEAHRKEKDGELGIEKIEAKEGSEIDDIQDEENIWELEPENEGDPDLDGMIEDEEFAESLKEMD